MNNSASSAEATAFRHCSRRSAPFGLPGRSQTPPARTDSRPTGPPGPVVPAGGRPAHDPEARAPSPGPLAGGASGTRNRTGRPPGAPRTRPKRSGLRRHNAGRSPRPFGLSSSRLDNTRSHQRAVDTGIVPRGRGSRQAPAEKNRRRQRSPLLGRGSRSGFLGVSGLPPRGGVALEAPVQVEA